MAGFGRDVRSDDSPQDVVLELILPDVPGGLVFLGRVLDERRAHREQDFRAVVRDFEIPHGAEPGRDRARDISLLGARRSLVAYEQVGADFEGQQLTQIRVRHDVAVIVHGQRALDVCDRHIENDGVGTLTLRDIHATAAASASAGG